MGPAAILSILVQTKGAGVAQAELTRLDKSAHRASGSLDRTSSAATKSGKTTGALAGSLKKAAVSAGALAAGYVSIHAAHSAVETTEELGHSTLRLHNVFGLTIKSAGELSAVLRTRGIDAKQAGQAFKTLSSQVVGAENGSKGAAQVFKSLGISLADIKGKDLNEQLALVSDGLKNVGPGVDKANAASKLFGRGWQALTPLLSGGSAALQEQLALADKYGATLGGKTVKDVEKLIEAQRANKLAMLGIQVTAGKVLLPVLTTVTKATAEFALQMREGKGAGGAVVSTFQQIAGAARTVWDAIQPLRESVQQIIEWLQKNQQVSKILIPALVGLAAAVWLVNTAMAANPFILAALAVAAFTVAIVTAYRESATFRKILDAVIGGLVTGFTVGLAAIETAFSSTVGFVKGVMTAVSTEVGEWKLLATVVKVAVGLMVAYVTPAFAAIKAAVGVGMAVLGASFKAAWGVVAAIFKGAWTALKGIVSGGLQAIGGVIKIVGGIFKGDFGQIWSGIKDVFRGGLHAITSLFKGELQTITGAAKAIGTGIYSAITGGFSAALRAVTGFVNSIIGVVNSVLGFLHLPKIPTIGGGKGGTSLKGIENAGAEQAPGGRRTTGLARGGAFARTQGLVKTPITLMGEEAPRHPEFVIPTNPAYRSRAQGLLKQAAGVIGLAKGGVVSGGTSVFGPPLEKAGGTDYGFSSAQPGIAVNPHMGANTWNDDLARSFARKVAKVTVAGHSAMLRVIDKGPAIPGRAIDITGAGASRMGINPAQFPTDATGTAVFGDGGDGGGIVGSILGSVGGVLQALNPAKYIAKLPSADGLPPFLEGVGSSLLKSVKHWITEKAKDTFTGGDTVGTGGLTEHVKAAISWARSHGWGGGVLPGGGFRTAAQQAAASAGAIARGIVYGPGGVQASLHRTGRAIDVSDPGGFAAAMASAPAAIRLYARVAKDPAHFSETGYAKGGSWGAHLPGGMPGARHVSGLQKWDRIYTERERIAEHDRMNGPYIVTRQARGRSNPGSWNHRSPHSQWYAKGGQYGKYIGAYKNGGPVPEDGMALLHKGEFVVPQRAMAEGGAWAANRASFYGQAWEKALTTSSPNDDALIANAAVMFYTNAAAGKYGSSFQRVGVRELKKWKQLRASLPFIAQGRGSTDTGFLAIPETQGVNPGAGGVAAATAAPKDDTTSLADIQKQILDTLTAINDGIKVQNARGKALTDTVDGTLMAGVTELISGRLATSAALGGQVPSYPGQTARL